jgi:hypothetical protein
MSAVVRKPVDQPWIFEQVRDRGPTRVLNNEAIGQDLGERSAALVLADDVSSQAAVPAPARFEQEEASTGGRAWARAPVRLEQSEHSLGFRGLYRNTIIMPHQVDLETSRTDAPRAGVSTRMGRAGIEPATLGLKVPCSTN